MLLTLLQSAAESGQSQVIWTPRRLNRQPSGPVEIDWNNPLARGLGGLLIFNQGRWRELVYNWPLIQKSTVAGASPIGIGASGLEPSGTDTGIRVTEGRSQYEGQDNEITLFVHGFLYDAAQFSGGTAGADLVNRTQSNITRAAFNDGRLITWAFATNSFESNSFDETVLSFGAAYTLAMSRRPGANGFTAYHNGRVRFTGDGRSGQLRGDAGVQNWNFGVNNRDAGGSNNNIPLGINWRRALTEAEHRALADNPYQFLKPVAQRSYFLFGGSTESVVSGVASTTGSATVTATGASIAAGIGSVTGAATVAGVSESGTIAAGVASTAGTATVSATGAARFAATASTAGTATVQATGAATAAGVGSVVGTATVDGVAPGSSIASGAGSSAGSSTAQATGAAVVAGVASSAGTGTATAVGRATAAAAASVAGAATVTAIGASTAAATAAAIGTGTATAVSNATGVAEGVGSSAGTATVQATGVSSAAGTAATSGNSTVAAVGVAIVSGVAATSGTSTAQAVGRSTAAGAGATTGTGAAQATATAITAAAGNATGVATALGSGLSLGTGLGTATAMGSASVIGVGMAVFLVPGVRGGAARVEQMVRTSGSNRTRVPRTEGRRRI